MKDMEEIRKKLVAQMFEHINSLPLDKREAYFKKWVKGGIYAEVEGRKYFDFN